MFIMGLNYRILTSQNCFALDRVNVVVATCQERPSTIIKFVGINIGFSHYSITITITIIVFIIIIYPIRWRDSIVLLVSHVYMYISIYLFYLLIRISFHKKNRFILNIFIYFISNVNLDYTRSKYSKQQLVNLQHKFFYY